MAPTPPNAGDRSSTGPRTVWDRGPRIGNRPALLQRFSDWTYLDSWALSTSLRCILLLMLETRRLTLPSRCPPHEATGVMLMSDTCVHRPSSRWIVAPCPISAGYRLGYLLNNTSSEQLLAKEKYMLRRQQHSDFGAFSSDFRSRQHSRSSSWSPQYPVLTKKPEPECKAGLDLTSGNTTFRALRHTSSWTVLVVREATGKVIQATTHSARPPKDSVKVETPGESGTWRFSMLEARSGKSFTSARTSRWSSQTLEDH